MGLAAATRSKSCLDGTSKDTEAIDWRARQLCKYCHGGECEDDTLDGNAMVLCDCCVDGGAHLKCLNANSIVKETNIAIIETWPGSSFEVVFK